MKTAVALAERASARGDPGTARVTNQAWNVRQMTSVVPNPPPLAENKGRIYWYSPAKLWHAALFAKIRLNGEPIGKPVPGRFFFKDIDPGTYEMTIRTEVSRKCMINIAGGQTMYVRMSAEPGWL